MARLGSILSLLLVAGALASAEVVFQFKHHTNAELAQLLHAVNSWCPSITRVYSVGKSVKGTDLLVIEFAQRPGQHVSGVPEFKYVANMHGNEVVGRELVLALIHHMCERYQARDPEVMALVARTRLHFLPTMNPDGYDVAYDWNVAKKRDGERDKKAEKDDGFTVGRANAHGVDLNRNFPNLDELEFADNVKYHASHRTSRWVEMRQKLLSDLRNQSADYEPETRAVAQWILRNAFVLSANLHGGDIVANYPYDESPTGRSEYTRAPDDSLFRVLARSYSTLHPRMTKPHHCKTDDRDEGFWRAGGITNGAEWYSVARGMQDFNYEASNCYEITLELGCTKFPAAAMLRAYWDENRRSLFSYMWQAHMGVKGVVRSKNGGAPLVDAVITVERILSDPSVGGSDYSAEVSERPGDLLTRRVHHDVFAVDPFGDYYRLLLPARPFWIQASKPGFKSVAKCVLLPERVRGQPSGFLEAVRLDFELEPSATGGLTVDASCTNPAASSDEESNEAVALEELAALNARREAAEDADDADDMQLE